MFKLVPTTNQGSPLFPVQHLGTFVNKLTIPSEDIHQTDQIRILKGSTYEYGFQKGTIYKGY